MSDVPCRFSVPAVKCSGHVMRGVIDVMHRNFVGDFSPCFSAFAAVRGAVWGVWNASSPRSIGAGGPSCCRLLSRFGSLSGKPETNPFRGYGAVGSASAWHAEGQGFESPYLHEIQKASNIVFGAFCVAPSSALADRPISAIANLCPEPSNQGIDPRVRVAVIPNGKDRHFAAHSPWQLAKNAVGIARSGQ
jgi:hypothetical protein